MIAQRFSRMSTGSIVSPAHGEWTTTYSNVLGEFTDPKRADIGQAVLVLFLLTS